MAWCQGPLSLTEERLDVWTSDTSLAKLPSLKLSAPPKRPVRTLTDSTLSDLDYHLAREHAFLLRWSGGPEPASNGSAQDCDYLPVPASLGEESNAYSEPPPGFKRLKRTPERQTNRYATARCSTMRTEPDLGDGFSGDEAKPLRDKSEGSGRKRKRCTASPFRSTLEAVLSSHSQKDALPSPPAVPVRNNIMVPLRPPPVQPAMVARRDCTSIDFVWMDADESLLDGMDGNLGFEHKAEGNDVLALRGAGGHKVPTEMEWDSAFALPPLRWV